eukprot:44060_1
MLVQLLLLNVLTITSKSELQYACNAAWEEGDSGYNETAAVYATGVCHQYGLWGEKRSGISLCIDGKVKDFSFISTDCSGKRDSGFKFCYTDCDSITHVCDQGPCQYVSIVEYDGVTSCKPTTYTSLGESDRDTNVANMCITGSVDTKGVFKSMRKRCNSTHAIKEIWNYDNINDDCDGKPSEIFAYPLGHSCREVSHGVYKAYDAKCGLAGAESNAYSHSVILLAHLLLCFFMYIL